MTTLSNSYREIPKNVARKQPKTTTRRINGFSDRFDGGGGIFSPQNMAASADVGAI
jgi:hypothetical protein